MGSNVMYMTDNDVPEIRNHATILMWLHVPVLIATAGALYCHESRPGAIRAVQLVASAAYSGASFARFWEALHTPNLQQFGRTNAQALERSAAFVAVGRFIIGCAFGAIDLSMHSRALHFLMHLLIIVVPPVMVAWSGVDLLWLGTVAKVIIFPLSAGFVFATVIERLIVQRVWEQMVEPATTSFPIKDSSSQENFAPASLNVFNSLAAYGRYKDYLYVRELGRGAGGRAVLLVCPQTSEMVVAKESWLGLLNESSLRAVETEVRLLSSVDHPNIISYRACYVDMQREVLRIVMELAAGGTLKMAIKSCVQRGASFPSTMVFQWTQQLGSALDALHRLEIVHRDIKPANIFLTADAQIKIGDFGLSRKLHSPFDPGALAKTACGTPYYMSPERLDGDKGHAKPADLWALGCVLYEMLTLKKCFTASSFAGLSAAIKGGEYDEAALDAAPHPLALKRLATKDCLLHNDPELRYEIGTLLVVLERIAQEAEFAAPLQPPHMGLPSVQTSVSEVNSLSNGAHAPVYDVQAGFPGLSCAMPLHQDEDDMDMDSQASSENDMHVTMPSPKTAAAGDPLRRRYWSFTR